MKVILFSICLAAILFTVTGARRLGEAIGSRKLVENDPTAKLIPQKYHVIFDDSVSSVAAKVAAISAVQEQFTHDERLLLDGDTVATATITRFYENVFKGMSVANMTRGLLHLLERDPEVISIHQDVEPRFLGTKKNNDARVKYSTQKGVYAHLDRLDQKKLPLDGNYTYRFTGKDVTVYVLDTGMRLAHDEFEGRASCGFDVVLGMESDIPCDDLYGHGTGVASMVGGKSVGVAKHVNLVSVKVTTVAQAEGIIPYENIVAGMDFIMKEKLKNQNKPMIAVMAIVNPPTPLMDIAAARLVESGVPLVLGAGNEYEDACVQSPQRVKTAFTVGASYSGIDAMTNWSDYGNCVDLYAPGEVFRAWINNNTHISYDEGTSYAAPLVAGAAAMVLEKNPEMAPKAISKYLQRIAVKNVLKDVPGNKNNYLLNVQSLL